MDNRYKTDPKRRAYIVQKVEEHRKRKRLKLIELLGGACEECGYNYYSGTLEFHHVNPEEKEFGLSADKMTRKWEVLVQEARKCVLLCANCHREVAAGVRKIGRAVMQRFAKP